MHVGELQTSLPTDVLAAFALHAKDLFALHNDMQGSSQPPNCGTIKNSRPTTNRRVQRIDP